MFYEALIAYLHYLSIILVLGSLFIELAIFKQKLLLREARLLQRVDSLYGLGSMLLLGTGLIRAFYFGKGSEYYFSNYIFLTKLGLFILIGLLSIYPTVLFMRWKKEISKDPEYIEVDSVKSFRTKTIIRLEVFIALLIPLLATIMARGFGFIV